jgi:GNAT superfamily N-acetyltransferase
VIEVRPVETDAGLEAWRSVRMRVVPDEPTATVATLRAMEKPGRLLLLAYLDGELAGSGIADRGDTGRGFVAPRVVPELRRRGVGTALLEALLPHAAKLDVPELVGHVDGRDGGALAFARRHGFEEVDRQVEQVKTIADERELPLPDGVTVTTVAERPELLRESYELACEGYSDMKVVGASVTVPLEDWLRDEATLPGGSFVALAGGEIVGYTGLVEWPGEPDRAENGLTVVRRAWRGRGLAPALKSRQLAWAAANGIREIVTWTQAGNEDMQRVNERVGFVGRAVELTMVRPLR